MAKKIFFPLLIGIGIAGLVVFRMFITPQFIPTVPSSGRTVEINMATRENKWNFDPAVIRVEGGDKVILHIFNEDTYDHGFALEVFGINKRLSARKTTTVEFDATRIGEFTFFCSVPCGPGHYNQKGKLIVLSPD